MVFIIGFALIIAMAVIWILSIIGLAYTAPFTSYLLPSSPYTVVLGMANVFFVLILPVMAILLLILRLLFNRRIHNRWHAGLWGFWSANLICFFVIASFLGRHFNQGATVTQQIDLDNINGDTLVIDLKEDNYSDIVFRIGNAFKVSHDYLVCNLVQLNIQKADGDQFELISENQARGLNLGEANHLASSIGYTVQQAESKLLFPRNFLIPKGEKMRAQHIEMILKVPEGKFVKINRKANKILNNINLLDYHVSPWRHRDEIWRMEDKGLSCTYCGGHSKDTDEAYSYQDFSKLHIEGKVKATVEKGDAFKVRVTGKEVYTRKVEMEQLGKALHIVSNLKNPGSPVRLFITMPQLESLDAENTDDIKITGFQENHMSISNIGRYDIKAFVNVDTLSVRQQGRNELDLRGTGNIIKVDLDSRARLDAEHFAVNKAEVKAKDGCVAKLSVADTLARYGVHHHNKITYAGNPVVVDY